MKEWITVESIFTVGLMVGLTIIFVRAIHGLELDEMFTSHGSGKLSHTKFWANIAYLVATLAFIRLNFTEERPAYLPELWLIYIALTSGNAMASKWISLKYKYSGKNEESQEVYPRYDPYAAERQSVVQPPTDPYKDAR